MSAQVIQMHPTASRLAELEAVLHRGQCAFYEVGKALRAIRDERLYDAEFFGTFEVYCKVRWQMSPRHMNRLIAASSVVDNLGPMGPKLTTERVARELMQLTPDDQREVWSDAAMRWDKPAAKQVREVVDEKFPKAAKPVKPRKGTDEQKELLQLLLEDLEQRALSLVNKMEISQVQRLYELFGDELKNRQAWLAQRVTPTAPVVPRDSIVRKLDEYIKDCNA